MLINNLVRFEITTSLCKLSFHYFLIINFVNIKNNDLYNVLKDIASVLMVNKILDIAKWHKAFFKVDNSFLSFFNYLSLLRMK